MYDYPVVSLQSGWLEEGELCISTYLSIYLSYLCPRLYLLALVDDVEIPFPPACENVLIAFTPFPQNKDLEKKNNKKGNLAFL